jgi:hypothetical protein
VVNSRPDRKVFLKPSTKPYQIFRNQGLLVGDVNNSTALGTYHTFIAPLFKDGKYERGYIAI